MNPSTEDILNAIEKIDADNVFVLPNNKNIILAANQAKDLTSDKNVVVIPTKTIPQGIAALIGYVPGNSAEDNERFMSESIEGIRSGEVTYAVRDTKIDDKEIKSGDYMGIGDGSILAVGSKLDNVVLDMIDGMVDDSTELISIYYGEDIDEAKAGSLLKKVQKKHKNLEIELQYGGQPIYYYIVSAE